MFPQPEVCASNRAAEIAALRHGLDLGMSLIDTAEMYGEGGAEEVITEAIVKRLAKGEIAGRRSEVFLVSKVYPHNASKRGVIAACERSLKRLKTDYLDLYLLHWRGSVPLAETLEAFFSLREAGKIRGYSVSNVVFAKGAASRNAWLLQQPNVNAKGAASRSVIPKSSRIEGVEDNCGALNLKLTALLTPVMNYT